MASKIYMFWITQHVQYYYICDLNYSLVNAKFLFAPCLHTYCTRAYHIQYLVSVLTSNAGHIQYLGFCAY